MGLPMTAYFEELCRAMETLSYLPNTVFMGQAVAVPGTAMSRTLENVPLSKRLELPVAEDMQLGMAIGMSLNGYLPICIYPRINFLLLAMNQLVLHLDKLPEYGNGYKPKVIIRTAVAHNQPMDPGPQHLGDFVQPIYEMLRNVEVELLYDEGCVQSAYEKAAKGDKSWLLVEYLARY